MNTCLRFLYATIAAIVAGSASAGDVWILGGTNASPGIAVGGYANTGAGSTADTQVIENQPITASSSTTNMWWYSGGWGINNKDGCSAGTNCDATDLWSDAPEHAIDNQQRYEMALLSFGSTVKVQLQTLTFGYTSGDADVTVMAYTGAAPFDPSTKLAGLTFAGLTAAGWTTVGNYSGTSATKTVNEGATKYSSSYWLVGAYNNLVGGACFRGSDGKSSSTYCDAGNDYVKLYSVGGIKTDYDPPPGVPEPGTLALFGAALLGMIGLRRRALT